MIQAHGNTLVNKLISDADRAQWETKAQSLPALPIANRYVSDCEMIANGGFSPLQGFMTQAEAEGTIQNMSLPDGTLWSIPIVLPLPAETTDAITIGQEVTLIDAQQRPIAIMKVTDKFQLNLDTYCQNIFQTNDMAHPGVKVVKDAGNEFIGGEILGLINRPLRQNIENHYYLDPTETRQIFQQKGWKTVVAFQTRNPIHRAHEYLIKCAMEPLDGVLIHPLVGETKKDDIPADVRMQCYEVLTKNYFNKERVALSALPASMHYAGPREAIHHMIMRQNYGCTHMIMGRDHAGVGNYYGTYDAQEMVASVADRMAIQAFNMEHSFYCTLTESMASDKTAPPGKEHRVFLSGTQVREMLQQGQRPPKEFTRPEVADVLIQWATQKTEPALCGTSA